jgi:hypothetical protein
MHLKIRSGLCNHKSFDTGTVIGCRLRCTMVCEGGNRAVDKPDEEILGKDQVK